MALLATHDLHCGYGADEIIHGVDFAVEPGEIVTILGPNGCGKTTFVKAILGYVKTTAGEIRFDGRDLRRLGPTERAMLGIGYVPQLLNIFKPLTVTENLEIGGYRLDRARARRRPGAPVRAVPAAPRAAAPRRPARCPAASASCSPWRAP